MIIMGKKEYKTPTLENLGSIIDNTLGSNPNTHNDSHGSPTGKS